MDETTSERSAGSLEKHPAVLGVRTGYVDFVGGESFAVLKDSDHFGVIFDGIPEHVREDTRAEASQRRQFFGDECSRSNVLESDGIEHACRRLPQSRRSVAFDRFAGETFDDDAADSVKVGYGFELDAIAISAGSGQDGIGEVDTAKGRSEAAHPNQLQHK